MLSIKGDSNTHSLIEAALQYASEGYKVHPLKENEKTPLLSGWKNLASSKEETIRQWWKDYPNANIGVFTKGLVVVDVDIKGGKDGEASLKDYGYVDNGKTFRVDTPSGGYHLYFKQGDFSKKWTLRPGQFVK
jgi:hypothetical protein